MKLALCYKTILLLVLDMHRIIISVRYVHANANANEGVITQLFINKVIYHLAYHHKMYNENINR